MVFWSFSFIWYKEVFVYYKPITLVFLRLVISSVFLFAITYSMRRLDRVKLRDMKYFLLLAFFEPFLYFIGESFGISLISSTLAAVIVSTIPLFSPIGAYYFYKERLTPMNFLGIVVSIVGVAMVIFHRGFGAIDANPLGIALMFLAVFAALGYSIMIKKLTGKYNVLSIITYQNSIGALFFLPLFALFEYNHFLSVQISWPVVLPLLKLGIFASSVAFVLFTYSIKHLGITKANIFTNTIPVLTAVFAYFWLGETLSVVMMAGILVVIFGLFLSQIRQGMFSGILFWRNGNN
jgi:drug/metabolite transporter (DMT)-like permease